jgi:hypothetical protein
VAQVEQLALLRLHYVVPRQIANRRQQVEVVPAYELRSSKLPCPGAELPHCRYTVDMYGLVIARAIVESDAAAAPSRVGLNETPVAGRSVLVEYVAIDAVITGLVKRPEREAASAEQAGTQTSRYQRTPGALLRS